MGTKKRKGVVGKGVKRVWCWFLWVNFKGRAVGRVSAIVVKKMTTPQPIVVRKNGLKNGRFLEQKKDKIL